MKSRRDFFKLAGISGMSAMGLFSLKGRGLESVNYKSDRIKGEFSKPNFQRFNMSGYAAPPINKVRIGFIGTGGRGTDLVFRISYIDGIEIKALCDLLPERAKAAKEKIKLSGYSPDIYAGDEEVWMKMCRREDIDLIYIATPWPLHTPMAVFAMQHGKHVATEVPAATTVEDSWRLVEASEKSKKHCIMLENTCYDSFELLTLNLARNGFFGEIVHGEGAYIHQIGERLFHRGNRNERWRLKQNIGRNGNLYPTHGLGPLAQIMKINRGNKMDYLVSTSTKDFMMNDIAKKLANSDEYYKQYVDVPYRGNMNTTTIATTAGQTIMLQHDITSPRPFSHIHQVSGTKAFAQHYPLPARIAIGHGGFISEDKFKKIEEQYNPPIIRQMWDIALKIGGHGGIDFLLNWRLIDCLRNGLPVDMDVYDAASWSVIGPLSEWSVANRSAPIDIPDFTNANWKTNLPHDISLIDGGTTGVKAW
ncbi:MAG: Gfo/Idh/MocA family oxidoreductase [Chitinophagaceae bacterium]|nr:Gfo/Idh/MocA family oxidoreductase [Chitinophagaceae bacterium]